MAHRITFSVRVAHLFFPGVPSSNYHGDPSKSSQGFTLCFSTSLSFRLIFLLFSGVLHGGSTWWFIKDLIRSRNIHQDYFQRSSSILLLVIQSAIVFPSYLLRWCYVILDNLSSGFMIHMLLRMRYFKPIIFSSFMRSFATHRSLRGSYLGLYFT